MIWTGRNLRLQVQIVRILINSIYNYLRPKVQIVRILINSIHNYLRSKIYIGYYFQIAKCTMKKNATVEDFFNKVCLEHEMTASEHFLRVKKKKEMPDSKFFVPQRIDLIDNYVSKNSTMWQNYSFVANWANPPKVIQIVTANVLVHTLA